MTAFKFTLFFLSLPLLAAEHALVIGGPSNKDETDMHEFARGTVATAMGFRAQGKEVKTLFGYFGAEEPLSPIDVLRKKSGKAVKPSEKELYKSDYQKIQKEFPETKAVTEETILGALRESLSSMNNGDKFTLVLNAHGHVQCPESSARSSSNGNVSTIQFGKDVIRNDFDENCYHEITVASSDGKPTTLKTEKIFPLLKEMEKKGVEVNAIFDSCHSGILKKDSLQLSNACSAFLSSGDSVGYGCFESDPSGNTDYTSTTEYLKFQAYAGIVEDLEKDPYFSNSKCFKKVLDHVQKYDLNLESGTISEAYWKARENDLAPHEPTLSDMMDLNYFHQGNFTHQFSFGKRLICSQEINEHLIQVESFIPETSRALFFQMRVELVKIGERYNQSLKNQESLINQRLNYLSQSESLQSESELLSLNNRIADAQAFTSEIQQDYLALERSMSPMFKLALRNKENNCDRKL